MMKGLSQTIYCDARALQDPDYRFRGVGQHASSLLWALREQRAGRSAPRLIGVADAHAAPLDRVHQALFDQVVDQPRRVEQGRAWFLSLSPMTHDPTWVAPLLSDERLYRIALFYDLIPLGMPERYLRAAAQRIDYVNALAWLRRYDTFASISRFSGDALVEALRVDPARVFVSGVAVRKGLEPAVDEQPLSRGERRWVVVAGGGDPRKNPECALRAHARSERLRQAGVRMAVFGNYPVSMREEFRTIYEREGGRPHDLVFRANMTDPEMHHLYREGLVTIVASRAEGFSIPIVESSAAGTPVVASDVGAHPELIENPAARFGPDDADGLKAVLEDLVGSEHAWESMQAQQADLWRRYTTEAVGRRFVEGVTARIRSVAHPNVLRGAKPQVAVLSPLPPALSGVADYTAATLKPAADLVDLHMFTDTPDARPDGAWRSMQPVAAAALGLGRFDAVVGVMGNSGHHVGVFEHLLTHGGACIAHDARQIDFYYYLLGVDRTVALASAELDRPVTPEQVTGWLQDQSKLPTLFLSEIAKAAAPLFVHSPTTAKLIGDYYDVDPVVLPFAQYRGFSLEMAESAYRQAARRRLGVGPAEVLIASFGIVSDDKAPEEILWAVRLLRDWGVHARLVFCGFAQPPVKAALLESAEVAGLRDKVRFFEGVVSEAEFAEYLAAADVGVQLRMYKLGGLSGALNDCIAAALPSVANEHLAEAMRAPPFVRRVPDAISAVLLAEAILEILQEGGHRDRPLQTAHAVAQERSPARYSQLLMEELGLDLRPARQVA